jgi:alpha-N-arabinofuranosidase
VRLANLAQTVNVLQSLILTNGRQMLLTPTYHVFDMFKVHQDARRLNVNFTSPEYRNGEAKIAALNISASVDADGIVHISFVNVDPNNKISFRAAIPGVKWTTAKGQILSSAKLTDINSFDKPDAVKIQPFTGAKKDGNDLLVELPAKSIVVVELR